MRKRILTVVATLAILSGPLASAQTKTGSGSALSTKETESVEPSTTALDSVVWQGSGASLAALHGKSVLVLSYVTWCPLCNKWSPDMLKQVKAAMADKPVVVLAIATETPTVPGYEYMSNHDFLGPNILHGQDPAINQKFGLEKSQLFNFALIDPAGRVVAHGSAGQYFDRPGDKKEFVPGVELAKVASKGEFEVISPEMSDTLKTMLWPIEMGQAVNDSALVQAKKTLKPDDAKMLDAAFAKYLNNQLEEVRKLVGKEIPDRLAAFEKATELSTHFKSTEPGKAARQIVIDLNKDKAFKRELLAKTAYAKLMQSVARMPERGEALRKGFQRTYQGTYYAQVASQAGAK